MVTMLITFSLQSVVNIGAACGALFVMIIADKIGRKNALVFSNFAAIFGWMLIICASEYQNNDSKFVDYMTLLIIGRLLTGFSAGWSSFAVPVSSINCIESINVCN